MANRHSAPCCLICNGPEWQLTCHDGRSTKRNSQAFLLLAFTLVAKCGQNCRRGNKNCSNVTKCLVLRQWFRAGLDRWVILKRDSRRRRMVIDYFYDFQVVTNPSQAFALRNYKVIFSVENSIYHGGHYEWRIQFWCFYITSNVRINFSVVLYLTF